ncbi:iron-siderophore ABC transporter substrate-binding protein [Nocardia yamanashiensis]|uniref:iron-siderophore ABC transporter substrate-binding protein n=1 Tax=Nocardia yamanashiensis TaxID=209247 RepID=UPI001E523AE9|nr:iron-siderophore ABC transporter substrate-binding protein [Nocardia yamanashiensis]UGT41865.1 iron-siderophore ABC transporter substrate-binding protein [Nocardia yamanashiensis]
MPVRESASTRIQFASSPSRLRRLRTWGVVPGAAAALAASLLSGCGAPSDDALSSIVRTTTNIAGAGVVGIERDTRSACALPGSADPASGATRTVAGVAGTAEVPSDPKRIVVLSTAALDAACGVGVWERVVGAATVSGLTDDAGKATPQPSYLGTGIAAIPSVGLVGAPDAAKIAELKPDLIIGGAGEGAAYESLKAIAPTVLIGTDGGWQAQFTGIAEAMGRKTVAAKALDDYRTAAKDAGIAANSSLTQASVVRFGAGDIQVQGGNSFAGQVLGDAGVQRPAAQRADSYDVGSNLGAQTTRNKLEGDILYVMFDGPDGLKFGKSTLKSDDWKELGAVGDHRMFAVDDSIWHGSGVIAARALLVDMSKSLNAYVGD